MSLRIAIVVDPWLEPYNGAVVSTRRFVEALSAAGHEIHILAIGGDAPESMRNHTITPFPRLSLPGFNHVIDAMRAPLARPIRARISEALHGCDLLHVQLPFWLGYAAIGEARQLGIPIVSSFHVQPENILGNIGLGGAALTDLLYRGFISQFFNRSTAIIAPTPFAANILRRHGATQPISVISNGVPDAFFKLARIQASDGRIRLLSVGRLAHEKRHDTLLHAVANCAHRGGIDLIFAGTGPREAELKSSAISLGLDARIGSVSDDELLALYASTDLFVHCGAVELEGMSVLEAMATGTAVVVSDSEESACAHLVTDESVRFRCGNSNDLARKIDALLDDRDCLVSLGAANRRRAAAFSHRKSVVKLQALYAEAIAMADAPAARAHRLPTTAETRV